MKDVRFRVGIGYIQSSPFASPFFRHFAAAGFCTGDDLRIIYYRALAG